MRRVLIASALLLASSFTFSSPAQASFTQAYAIAVEGQTATGIVGVPANGAPVALLVLAHGFGGNAAQWSWATEGFPPLGVAVVAMDYRGAQGAWKVDAGWKDTLAATLDLQARYPTIQRTVIWGVSMGGEVSGLAVAHAPHGTYQYWVDDAGVQNLAEEWADVPGFQGAIQAETGGTPADAPQAYVDRSPALQATAIAGEGLTRAFFFHYPNDNIVPYSHARETATQLAALGAPVSVYTAVGLPGVPALPPTGVPPLPTCHCGAGYGAAYDKAIGLPDWPVPALEGVVAPSVGYAPPVSPPALL